MSLCHKTPLFFFLLLSLITFLISHLFPTSSALSHEDLNSPQPPQASPNDPFSGWGTKVPNLEGPTSEPLENYPSSSSSSSSSSFALAAQRTQRKDPLNGFKKYTGGWNLSERHYWSSVGFTAVPLFAIAAIWFLCFGLFLSLICLCHLCCKTRRYGYSNTAYTLSLVLLVLFSIAAIAGCVVLYTGQEKFHRSTTSALEYVVDQAGFTVGKLKNVSDYLAEAKQLGVDNVFLPSNVQTDIDQIGAKINASASNLADATADNSDNIKDLLDSMRLALIMLAAIMLILIFLGLLFSIFGMQILVYILVVSGWLLVTGTFILCGTFILLHNVAGDTCAAMNEWVVNPTAHTAVDEIMPCVDKEAAQETLVRSKEVTSEMVDVINEVITNVSNINFAPNFVPLYFNQSGPLVPLLCNPYFHDLTDRPCSSGEVWASYVCQVSGTGFCATTGRLTPTFYSQMSSGVGIGIALNEHSPFLVDLQDCTFARETFARIYSDHCPLLRRYSKWVYVGLAVASAAVMMSLVFWVVYGRERRRRINASRSSAASDHCGDDPPTAEIDKDH